MKIVTLNVGKKMTKTKNKNITFHKKVGLFTKSSLRSSVLTKVFPFVRQIKGKHCHRVSIYNKDPKRNPERGDKKRADVNII